MNNPKHTPGPWLARKHSIQANSGRMIATLSIGNETCKANARLIATAPELFSFAEYIEQRSAKVADLLRDGNSTLAIQYLTEIDARAFDVLSKATGSVE